MFLNFFICSGMGSVRLNEIMRLLVFVWSMLSIGHRITYVNASPEIECSQELDFNVTFDPVHLRMREDVVRIVSLTIPVIITNYTDLRVASSDQRIFHVTNVDVKRNNTGNPIYFTNHSNCSLIIVPYTSLTGYISTIITVEVTGVRIGKAELIYTLTQQSDTSRDTNTPITANLDHDHKGVIYDQALELPLRYPVVVLRNVGVQHRIFHIVVQILLGILNFGFGCELDMSIVISYIRKPLAPSIGFCSQFLIMPVVSHTQY